MTGVDMVECSAAVLRSLKKHDLALCDYTNATLLDPKYAAAYCTQQGLVHMERGDYSQVKAALDIPEERILELDEDNLEAILAVPTAFLAAFPRTPLNHNLRFRKPANISIGYGTSALVR